MNCSDIQTIRNTCGNVLGGIQSIIVRDWDSFDWVKIINTYSAPAYTNLYFEGTYSNIEVYSVTRDVTTTLTANIIVNSAHTITSVVINNTDTYFYSTIGEIFSFPTLPIWDDNSDDYTIVVNSQKNSSTKYVIDSGVLLTNDRTVNDFGETISSSWYQLEFIKNSAVYNTKQTIDTSTGGNSWETELSLMIRARGTTSKLNLLTNQRPIVAIVKDWNGEYWLSGLNNPLFITNIDRMSGTKLNDPNNTKITFKGTDNHSEIGGFTI